MGKSVDGQRASGTPEPNNAPPAHRYALGLLKELSQGSNSEGRTWLTLALSTSVGRDGEAREGLLWYALKTRLDSSKNGSCRNEERST
jgi:hypothetical protein